MFNFLTKIFIIFTIYCSGNLLAMQAYDEDVEKSKISFLISGAIDNVNDKSKGVMTLCFKKSKKTGVFDHCALVFEMFTLTKPLEVTLCLIHYAGIPGNCGKGKEKEPCIEHDKDVLKIVYRAKVTSATSNKIQCRHSDYTRYASWILPNNKLLKAYDKAQADREKHKDVTKYDSYTCVEYVTRIMRSAEIKVDFSGSWPNTPDHLKWLIGRTKDEAGCFGGYIKSPPGYIMKKNYTAILPLTSPASTTSNASS